MKKRLVFASVGLTFVGLAAAIVACGDDKDDSVFPSRQEDASFDTGPGFFGDGGEQDAEPVVCNPSLPSQFEPTWIEPTRVDGACEASELEGYYDNCLPNFDEAKCTDWLAAHAACGACIQREDNSGPIQVFREPVKFYRMNQGGCVALVQGKTDADECGAAYEAQTECTRVSCEDCLGKGAPFGSAGNCTDDDDPTSFVCCQKKQEKSGCAKYVNAKSGKCAPDMADPDGGAPACFTKSSSESARDLYLRAMGVFCGP